MNKHLLILLLALISFTTSATTIPVMAGNSMIWDKFRISERIDPKGEDVTKDSINDIFKGKKIIIDNTNITVSGACKYEYSRENMTPLEYWHSQKTVNLYKQILSDHNVKLSSELNLITPVSPSVECVYPFSYFIEADNSLIFVLKNRAIIYSQKNEEKSVFDDECKHKEQTPEQIVENGDIDECYYKNLNVLNSYKKYRERLTGDRKKYLRKKINLNENFTMKCDNGCITVIYKWNGSDNLVITQQFEGGETVISFSKEAHGCQVVTKSFAD